MMTYNTKATTAATFIDEVLHERIIGAYSYFDLLTAWEKLKIALPEKEQYEADQEVCAVLKMMPSPALTMGH